MALAKISHVKQGSIVRVIGVDYKVALNLVTDLQVQKKVGNAFFEEKQQSLRGLTGIWGASTYIEVLSEPKADLTSTLRAQLGGTHSHVVPEIKASPFRPCDRKESYPYTPYTPKAPAVDLAASLRAQIEQQSAAQAKLDASVLAKKVDGVKESLGEFERAHEKLADKVERVDVSVAAVEDRVAHHAHTGQRVTTDLSKRLLKVEATLEKEAQKVSYQNELNKSLSRRKATESFQAQLNGSQKSSNNTGGNKMKNVFGAFKNQFGKVEGKFAFSLVTGGLALRKGLSQEFVAYDPKTKSLTDVSGLTLDFNVPAFKLPTTEKDVKVGDLIIHNGEFVYVTGKSEGYIEILNPEKGVNGSVVPTKNALLGAAFYTVVKTLDAAGGSGFNPLLLMAMGDGKKDDLLPLLLMSGGLGGGTQGAAGAIDPMMLMMLGDDVDDLLPLVLMQQGGVTGQGFNPLMFLAMNKEGKKNDLLPLLLMSGGLGGQAGAFGGGAQAGGINPLMLMMMSGDGGGTDLKDLFMMQAFSGQNLFGGVQAPVAQTPASSDAPAGE